MIGNDVVDLELAKEAIRLAISKLPGKATFIAKEEV